MSILRYPLPDGTLPVVVFSSTLQRLAGLPPGLFLSYGFQVVIRSVQVISYPADVPCPGPLPSSDLFNHVCDHCIFSYLDICFSVPVCDV